MLALQSRNGVAFHDVCNHVDGGAIHRVRDDRKQTRSSHTLLTTYTIACNLGAALAHWRIVQLTLTQLDFLRSPAGEPLLSMPLPGDALAAIGVLRKLCTPDQAAAVMTLRELRERAERTDRFPPAIARRLLASDKMLQQASSLRLSVYKGRRMLEVAGRAGAAPTILDLCCGLGADAIGLALAGAEVRGYDRDEAAVLCATHNAAIAGQASRCRFHAADVTAIELSPESIVHADPDRRATGRRAVSLAWDGVELVVSVPAPPVEPIIKSPEGVPSAVR